MPWTLSPKRCFSADPAQRALARELYDSVKELPIVSLHGHVPPALLADPAARFGTPTELFIIPDHYVFRMLYGQGVALEDLGIPSRDGTPVETDHRRIWQRFAEHFYLFRGMPTGLWLAGLVVQGLIAEDEGAEMAHQCASGLAKGAYKLDKETRSSGDTEARS
jgi:glucuronate isomerase